MYKEKIWTTIRIKKTTHKKMLAFKKNKGQNPTYIAEKAINDYMDKNKINGIHG